MCTEAYRQALIRDLYSTPSPAHVELPGEKVASDAVAPAPEQMARLDNLTPAAGRHDKEGLVDSTWPGPVLTAMNPKR